MNLLFVIAICSYLYNVQHETAATANLVLAIKPVPEKLAQTPLFPLNTVKERKESHVHFSPQTLRMRERSEAAITKSMLGHDCVKATDERYVTLLFMHLLSSLTFFLKLQNKFSF